MGLHGKISDDKVEMVENTPRIYQINNQLRDHVLRLNQLKDLLRQTVVQLGGGWPEAEREGDKMMSGEECSLDLLSAAVEDFGYQLTDLEEYLGRLKDLV